MSRERRINYNGKKVTLLKSEFNVYMLDKIQGAIEEIKTGNSKEATVTLTFNELQLLRRLLIIDDLTTEFCRDNMLEGLELMKSKRPPKEDRPDGEFFNG